MVKEDFAETALPKASGAGAPAQLTHTIYQTRHGIVQGWTTVKGQPVAIVQQRSTYDHDIDSVVGFLGFGVPVADPRRVQLDDVRGQDRLHLQLVLRRRQGHRVLRQRARSRPQPGEDPTLPTWGTGKAEWQRLPQRRPAPARGRTRSRATSSAGTTSRRPASPADGDYSYGQTYRSVLLVKQLQAQLTAHPNGGDPRRGRAGDGDRGQPGPRRCRPERPILAYAAKHARTRRRPGDARAAEGVERERLPPAQGAARATRSTPTTRPSRSPTSWSPT